MEENLSNTPDADAIANGGASLRDTKSMDGPLALPDEKTQKRAHGDEPACSGVQSPANDQHHGGRATD
jgi:hypothetical protein